MPRLVGKPKTPIMLKIPVVMRINVDFILESFGFNERVSSCNWVVLASI